MRHGRPAGSLCVPPEVAMTRQHDSMIHPNIEQLLAQVDSKFGLVTLASYRAREINDYFNQLGEGLGHIIPPQVSSVARKPLSIAFEEIAAEKIVKVDKLPEDELAGLEAEAAEIFGDGADDGVDVTAGSPDEPTDDQA